MADLEVLVSEKESTGVPRWIARLLHVTSGRDPLGLTTITADRITPLLLPGVLALSVRARYLSYYCFLLKEFEDRKLPATNEALSRFIKAREFELAMAVRLCQQAGCGDSASSVQGRLRAFPAVSANKDLLPRGESVESQLGGYGLFYRSSLGSLGLAVLQGSAQLGEELTPVDVLARNELAQDIAGAYKDAVAETAYYRDHFTGTEAIPREVLVEFATVGCLCRLADHPLERSVLRMALFEQKAGQPEVETIQRRRSFALFLDAMRLDNQVPVDAAGFRRGLWEYLERYGSVNDTRGQLASQWGAFTAKEYWQEGLSVMWEPFVRAGCELQPPDGLSTAEISDLIGTRLIARSLALPGGDKLKVDPSEPAEGFARACIQAFTDQAPESVRSWAIETEEPIAGLALIFVLFDRMPSAGSMPSGWQIIGSQSSERQPSLLSFGAMLRDHLQSKPSLNDTLEWIIRRHIISAHLEVAYSKSPLNTFRFRWSGGRLRFFPSMENWRFETGDNRRHALASLSQDLGLWETIKNGGGALTSDGQHLVAATLS